MAFSALTAAEVTAGAAWTDTTCQKIKDDFDYLYGLVGTLSSIGVANGSFEIDSDADGVPDNWVKALYAGGAFAMSTTAPDHGLTHIKFTHPGGASNGGGSLTSDYIECSELITYTLKFIHWASAAGMKNKVQIAYYTKAKVAISTLDLYNSTANPTSPTVFMRSFTPAATARYFKIILVGGFTDTDVSGSAYFDDLLLGVAQHCKVWANVVGTGTPAASAGAFNVSSITDNGTGFYTVVFDCDLLDANYACIVTVAPHAVNDYGGVYAPTTLGTPNSKAGTGVDVYFYSGDGSAAADVAEFYIACFR